MHKYEITLTPMSAPTNIKLLKPHNERTKAGNLATMTGVLVQY